MHESTDRAESCYLPSSHHARPRCNCIDPYIETFGRNVLSVTRGWVLLKLIHFFLAAEYETKKNARRLKCGVKWHIMHSAQHVDNLKYARFAFQSASLFLCVCIPGCHSNHTLFRFHAQVATRWLNWAVCYLNLNFIVVFFPSVCNTCCEHGQFRFDGNK